MGIILNRAPFAPMLPEVEALPSPAKACTEFADVTADRLGIAVEELQADLEAAVGLIRELRTPPQIEGEMVEEEEDAELVAIER